MNTHDETTSGVPSPVISQPWEMMERGQYAFVAHYPTCDIHKYERGVEGVEAHYDGKTRPTGQWAFMCDECWPERSIGLGTGLGQRLFLESALPETRED
jgi:hypothetical protein